MVLDAPVSGGCHRASTGNILFCWRKKKSKRESLPDAKIIGFEIVHVAQPGKASILKVVTNFLALTNLVTIGEALMVSKKAVLMLVKPMTL